MTNPSESSPSIISELLAAGRITQEEADRLAAGETPAPTTSTIPPLPSPSAAPIPSYVPPALPPVVAGPVEPKLPLLPILLITIGTYLAVFAMNALFSLFTSSDGAFTIVTPLFLSAFILATVGFVLQLKPGSTTRRAAAALYAGALPAFFWGLLLLLFYTAGGDGYIGSTTSSCSVLGGSTCGPESAVSFTTMSMLFIVSAAMTFALALLAYWRAPAIITQLALGYSLSTLLGSVAFLIIGDNNPSTTVILLLFAILYTVFAALWYTGIQQGRLKEKKTAEVLAALAVIIAVPLYGGIIVSSSAWAGAMIILGAIVVFALWRLLPSLEKGNATLIVSILAFLVGIEVIITAFFTGAVAILFGLFLAIAVITAGIIWWVMVGSRKEMVTQ